MRAKRLSTTLNHGIYSELRLIQALKKIAERDRQHQIREWLRRGLGIVAEGGSVDSFTASGSPSTTLRLFIQLNEDIPKDKMVLEAMTLVAQPSRALWIKQVLVAGFSNTGFDEQSRTRLDIDLSDETFLVEDKSSNAFGQSVKPKADLAVTDRAEKPVLLEATGDASAVVPVVASERPSKAKLPELKRLFQ